MLISMQDVLKYCLKLNGVIHVGGFVGEEIPVYFENGARSVIVFEPLIQLRWI